MCVCAEKLCSTSVRVGDDMYEVSIWYIYIRGGWGVEVISHSGNGAGTEAISSAGIRDGDGQIRPQSTPLPSLI